jgi:8-oxoguanine deaminase
MRLWIKDPLAILAPDAERGIVVEGAEIVECVARGRLPATPADATFDAARHVVLPGLVNAHHHFYQTLTRAHPAGFGKELIPWLVAMERRWDRMTPEALRIAVRMALVELMLSGCTTAADHHNLFPPGLENAIDVEVEEATKLGLRMTVTRGSMGISEKDGGLQPDSSSWVGQTPMPNAMSEAAQWQTLTPARPRRSISLALKWIPCATQARGLNHPASSRRSTERIPNVSTL